MLTSVWLQYTVEIEREQIGKCGQRRRPEKKGVMPDMGGVWGVR